MQKKLIALAVAGLVSGGAFAQSNVTIYGIVDVNLASQSTGYGGKLQVGTGGRDASRLGFKGEEALGNGLSAVWTLEQGLSIDTASTGAVNTTGVNNANPSSGGATGAGTKIYSRQSFAGLSGNFGTVTLGRQYTASYFGGAALIGPEGAGLYGNIGSALLGSMPTRMDNSIVYKSPKFGGGFWVWGTYSTGSENNLNADTAGTVTAGTGTTTNDKAGRGYDLALIYQNGPLNAILSGYSVNRTSWMTTSATQTLESGLAKNTGWLLGGNYNFGPATLHLGYISSKVRGGNWETATLVATPTQLANNYNQTATWFLGGVIPVSAAGRIALTYANFNDKSTNNMDMNTWGASYLHQLSKRTVAYVNYGKLNNNNNASIVMISAGDLVGSVKTAGDDPSAFMVGVSHSF